MKRPWEYGSLPRQEPWWSVLPLGRAQWDRVAQRRSCLLIFAFHGHHFQNLNLPFFKLGWLMKPFQPWEGKAERSLKEEKMKVVLCDVLRPAMWIVDMLDAHVALCWDGIREGQWEVWPACRQVAKGLLAKQWLGCVKGLRVVWQAFQIQSLICLIQK